MKKTLLAAPILFMACMVQEQPLHPEPKSLRESRDIWESLKSKHGNSYSYSTRRSSVFGFWREYEFSIRNDSMETIFVSSGQNDSTGITTLLLDFDTLSSTEKGWYKTIDEHYQFCRDSVLTLDKSKNDISELQFLGNGVLKSCTYYPHGCQDDCTIGPRIDSVSF